MSAFVDLQVNGFVGVDFSGPDLSSDGVANVVDELVARGTAVFLPTIITSSMDRYARNLPILAAACQDATLGVRLPGLHVEGPFLNPTPGAIGAHDSQSVLSPNPCDLRRLQDLAQGTIRMLTIAADQPGADELCAAAVEMGIVVSLGHHVATGEDLRRLADAGASTLTHLGNGMPNEVHRHNNPLIAGLACNDLTAMLITDGHHLPPDVIRLAFRSRPIEKIIVTSDASAVAGLPPGRYTALGSELIIEPSGLLRCADRDCLAGSSATMRDCINHLASLDLLDEAGLWTVGRDNPLSLLGLTRDALPATPDVRYDPEQKTFFVV